MQSVLSSFLMPPLDSFLSRIDRTVVVYDGFEWFSTVLAGVVTHSLSGQRNAFLYAPNGNVEALTWLRRIGVRSSRDRNSEFSVIIYNNNDQNKLLKDILTKPDRFLANPCKAERVVIVERDDLRFSTNTVNLAYAHTGASRASLRDLIENGASRLITNDWKAAVMAKLMSIPCRFLSGPAYPAWVEPVLRSDQVKVTQIRDKKHIRGCPCLSPAYCHLKEGLVKPCLDKVTPYEAGEWFGFGISARK